MKKFVLFSIVALFFGAFATPKASAQSYAPRVINVCPVCHTNVYAYYRPINYGGVVRYTWVPSYHTNCAARVTTPTRYVTKYHRGTPYRYAVPSHGHHHNHHHSHSTRISPRYSGYVRPGFSITITR
ncbi:MAG: hypothetical protein P1U89_16360 [Verrucomicrobiales bacterium]|nr:hypothetical protein [Verrucomicrobiales bacterium]